MMLLTSQTEITGSCSTKPHLGKIQETSVSFSLLLDSCLQVEQTWILGLWIFFYSWKHYF